MIFSISGFIRCFRSQAPSPDEKAGLFQQLTLMTLSRASNVDLNIKNIEVETIRTALKEVTGQDASDEQIRINANSNLFEEIPLEKILARVGPFLETNQRIKIVTALAQVIRSDAHVSSREIPFYNMVCEAFQLTPANIAGLVES